MDITFLGAAGTEFKVHGEPAYFMIHKSNYVRRNL